MIVLQTQWLKTTMCYYLSWFCGLMALSWVVLLGDSPMDIIGNWLIRVDRLNIQDGELPQLDWVLPVS